MFQMNPGMMADLMRLPFGQALLARAQQQAAPQAAVQGLQPGPVQGLPTPQAPMLPPQAAPMQQQLPPVGQMDFSAFASPQRGFGAGMGGGQNRVMDGPPAHGFMRRKY